MITIDTTHETTIPLAVDGALALLEGLPPPTRVGIVTLNRESHALSLGLAANDSLPVFKTVSIRHILPLSASHPLKLSDVVSHVSDWALPLSSHYDAIVSLLTSLASLPPPPLHQSAGGGQTLSLYTSLSAILEFLIDPDEDEGLEDTNHQVAYPMTATLLLTTTTTEDSDDPAVLEEKDDVYDLALLAGDMGLGVSIHLFRLYGSVSPQGDRTLVQAAWATGGGYAEYGLPMGSDADVSARLTQDLYLAGVQMASGATMIDVLLKVRSSSGVGITRVAGPMGDAGSTGMLRSDAGLTVWLQHENPGVALSTLPIVQLVLRGTIYHPRSKAYATVTRVATYEAPSLSSSVAGVLEELDLGVVLKTLATRVSLPRLSMSPSEHHADRCSRSSPASSTHDHVVRDLVSPEQRVFMSELEVFAGSLWKAVVGAAATPVTCLEDLQPFLRRVFRGIHALMVQAKGWPKMYLWVGGRVDLVSLSVYPACLHWPSGDGPRRGGEAARLPLSRRAMGSLGDGFVVLDGGAQVLVYGLQSGQSPAKGSPLRARYERHARDTLNGLGVTPQVVFTWLGGVSSESLDGWLYDEGLEPAVPSFGEWTRALSHD